MRLLALFSRLWPDGRLIHVSVVPALNECRPIGPDAVRESAFLWTAVWVRFGYPYLRKLVTSLVSRHLVVEGCGKRLEKK